MRNQTVAAQDLASGVVATAPWRVARVRTLPGYRLAVEFLDGTAGKVDLSRLITGERAGVFAALRSPESFDQAGIEHGVVVWPDGLDLAPDAMHEAIREHGRWVVE